MKANTYFDKTKKRPNIVALIFLIVGLIFLFALLGTCWYTVDEQETAVVTTFGRVSSTSSAGIHFKLPFGIQKVKTVETNVYQKIEIGYATKEDGTYTSIESESKMITGDYNIVNVDFSCSIKSPTPLNTFTTQRSGYDSEKSRPEPDQKHYRLNKCRQRIDRRKNRDSNQGQGTDY